VACTLGNLNRLQRSVAFGEPPFRRPTFNDDEFSLPIAAMSQQDGAPFTLDTVPGKQGRRRYGVHGDTYVSVVEFWVNNSSGFHHDVWRERRSKE
jgi:hypothetical protein